MTAMMYKRSFTILVALICMCFIIMGNVYASDNVRLTLYDCISLGLEYNADVILARMDYELAQTILERAQLVGEEELIESSAKALKDAEDRFNNVKRSVSESIEKVFYNLCKTKEALETEEKGLERARIQLEANEIRFEAGLVAPLDIEISRNDFLNRITTYENSWVDFETQCMEFNKLLGISLDTKFELYGDFEIELQIISIDFEEAYELALNNRSDVAEARKQMEEAQTAVDNLNNPYSARVDFEKAVLELKRKELLLNQKYDDVFLEVRQDCISLERAEKRIYKAETSLEFAIKNSEIVNLKYDAGLISMQQFLDNQNELAAAEKAVVQSKWDYHNSKLDYMKTIGMPDLDRLLQEIEANTFEQTAEGGNESNV